MNPSEYLSPDILERKFVRCFMPIHITQYILGSSRVDVRANFVMPTTRLQKFYSLILVVIVGVASNQLSDHFYWEYYKVNRTVFLTIAVTIFFNYSTLLCKLFHIRFIGVNDSIRLYLLLQKIDRRLGLTDNINLYRKQTYFNCMIVVLSFLFISGGIVHVVTELNGNPAAFCLTVVQVLSYLEVMFVGGLVHFVTVRLRFVNKEIKEYIADKEEKLSLVNTWITADIPVKKDYTSNSSKEKAKELIITLKLIMAAFKTINRVYAFQVMALTTSLFVWPLLIIEGLVLGIGVGTKMYASLWLVCLVIVIIVLLTAFFYFQLIFISVICDRFENQIKLTKQLCIDVQFKNYEGALTESMKDMLAIIECEAPKFSVYGIFTVDRQLPFHLMSLTTAYIIILVQFTLF